MTRSEDEFVVKYEEQEFEVSRFLLFHPGGRNTLGKFKNLDIDKKLKEYEHSEAAMYLMRDFKKGNAKTSTEPDDLEELIDWSKPLRSQVGQLGSKYDAWVRAPVDREVKMFDSPILELLTLAPVDLVLAVWIPIITSVYCHGYFVQNQGELNNKTLAALLALGVFSWTIAEYLAHRFLFHRVPSADSPEQIKFHFTLHGLHHKVPFAKNRLLFPPVAAVSVAMLVYIVALTVLPTWVSSLYISGNMLGYLLYDLTHYYLHYGSPVPDSYLYHMKRYHNRHHFTHSDEGFGISTDLWDRIFKTEIPLPKLLQTLKW